MNHSQSDTALGNTLIAWLDERLAAILAAPPMWGSPDAVEAQVLLLLEMRAMVLQPAQTLAEPRGVLDAYIAHLVRRFPGQGSRPLHELLTDDDETYTKLAEELRRFAESLPREAQ